MKKQKMVEDFMTRFGQPVRRHPTGLPSEEIELRMRLIYEESYELREALYDKDLIGIADGLADLLYVVYGTAAQCGIDINPIFEEVHRSNMTKVGGELDSGGKLIKPSTYSYPKLAHLLQTQIDKE